MPRPKNPDPTYASAIRQRREELSQRDGIRFTQEDIAARSGEAVSQRTVSHLESGAIDLGSLASFRVVALARALDWSLAELQKATGVDLGAVEVEKKSNGLTETIVLPSSFEEAIREYGEIAPELKDLRWQKLFLNMKFQDNVPESGKDWLNLLSHLKLLKIEPK